MGGCGCNEGMGVGVVSRHDCVNACVQCMHLELVAELYM